MNTEHHKEFNIIVNLKSTSWDKEKISYDQVIKLAFPNPNPPKGVPIKYTVEYARGPEENTSGKMQQGDHVFVKDDMVFTADETGRS